MTLYAASVPVFLHYLGQMRGLVTLPGADLNAAVGDAFPAHQQFATAANFSLRVTLPLAGRQVILPEPGRDRAGLCRQIDAVCDVLRLLPPADFIGAESRVIPHRAGQADLAQTGAEYLHLYGMPNFFFHMSMGYAALRASGLPLGKGYFDGYHRYPTDIPTPGV